MKNAICFRSRAGKRAAFTQIELLVLVVVIGVLGMVGLAGSAKLSNQTKIAQCSNNLRQLNLGQLLYAADNSDNLPINTGPAQWPWDIAAPVAVAMNQYGVPTNAMYCPTTAPRFNDELNFTSTNSLWSFGGANYHIIGYSMTLGNYTLAATNLNFSVSPQQISVGTFVVPSPSQRVLTADAILSEQENSGFFITSGGFTQNGVRYPFISSHLEGNYPTGGNVAMLDGHVEWRPFKQMKIRTILGSSPYFYW